MGEARVTRQQIEVLGSGEGEVRVARQQIEVLGSGEGEARVTRQYIEVLGSRYIVCNVSDDLDLVEGITLTLVLLRSVQDTGLSILDDEATCQVTRYPSLSDDFDLDDEASAFGIHCVIDAVTLTDEAECLKITPASDTLELSDAASAQRICYCVVEDNLSLVDVGISIYVVIDTLALTDEAECLQIRLVSDTLELSDAVSVQHICYCVVEDDLALDDGVSRQCFLERSITDTQALRDNVIWYVEDTLTLADNAVEYIIHFLTVSDDLELDDSIEVNAIRWHTVTDILELDEDKNALHVTYHEIGDFLPLSDRLSWFSLLASATDVLQYEHTDIGPAPDYEVIVTYLGLDEYATTRITRPRTGQDQLWLRDRAYAYISNEQYTASVTDDLELLDTAGGARYKATSDLFSLFDAAEAIRIRCGADTLSLSDTVARTIVRNLIASDDLELGESVLYYNALENYLHVYYPFVGAGPPSNPTPPPVELEGPIPGITDPFKLVYPVVGPFTDTLVLRSPNLGNRDRLQMNRVSRETRGGTLVVYADPIWPKIQTLALIFSGLTWTQANGLHTFINNHLGLEIGMLDHEHRFWKGIVTKFDDPIVQDGKGCKYTVGFEFEGELATYDPGP